MQKQRNNKGQFVKNEFKGLQYEETQPIKPFPYGKSLIAMAIILGLIALAHYLGWVEFPLDGGV